MYINKLWSLEGGIYKLMVIVDLDIVKTYMYSPVTVFIELIRSQKKVMLMLLKSYLKCRCFRAYVDIWLIFL